MEKGENGSWRKTEGKRGGSGGGGGGRGQMKSKRGGAVRRVCLMGGCWLKLKRCIPHPPPLLHAHSQPLIEETHYIYTHINAHTPHLWPALSHISIIPSARLIVVQVKDAHTRAHRCEYVYPHSKTRRCGCKHTYARVLLRQHKGLWLWRLAFSRWEARQLLHFNYCLLLLFFMNCKG